MLRTVLFASLLSFSALAPLASAQPGESCVVALWTQGARVECDGLLYEAATVTWCPQHPAITCIDQPLFSCGVTTTWRPPVTCLP